MVYSYKTAINAIFVAYNTHSGVKLSIFKEELILLT